MINAHIVIEDRPGPSAAMTDAIDVLSFSFGVSQTGQYQAGSSGRESRAGRADVQNVTFMKVLDKTSPLLFDDCATGNILSKATMFYMKPMGDQQEAYFKIEMEDVLITSVQTSGSSENPVESVSLAFEKVKFCYNPEDDEGKLAGWVEKGFDTSTLKPF